jgi:ParB family chromosome partitioning protein
VVGNIIELEIDAIEINRFNPEVILMRIIKRTCYSIKELGVIQPITVRKLDFNKYQLISGERRLRASTLIGLTTVPAYIHSK